MKNEANKLLFVVDIAGTLVFAVEGATAAMRANLDLLGLMVLAFATALGGGIIRDVLIGDAPPASLRDWRYSAVAFTGAAVVFFLHAFVQGGRSGDADSDFGRGGFGFVRDCGDAEGAGFWHASFRFDFVGYDYGSWRRHGTRRVAGAGSWSVAGGRVCDRGAGGVGGDDRVLQIALASGVGGGDWWLGLFLAAGDQRVAALEFAAGDGLVKPSDGRRELAVTRRGLRAWLLGLACCWRSLSRKNLHIVLAEGWPG
jgi:Glycine transporter